MKNGGSIMKIINLSTIEGGVTAPKGFLAAGLYCGIKKSKPDLAVVYSQVKAASAGVFTRNVVKAAPVIVTREHLSSGYARAVVVNSGNANACTGEQGLADARQMAVVTGEALGIAPENVVVASTGIIGVPLPMEKIVPGIAQAAGALSETGGSSAARAIMTTDTVLKETAVSLEIGGVPVVIGAMAKGSGMIHPNMATMLSFITTDVSISPALLQQALKECADRSFNRITVDGDTSTNDMVVALANGKAGNPLIDSQGEDYEKFKEALEYVCVTLAKMIARDGEGATKFIEIQVVNAGSEEEASLIARSIAASNLFKTAMFAGDANWGRIIAAAGYSGAEFDPGKVNIWLESSAGKEQVTQDGVGLSFDEDNAALILKEKDIKVLVDLRQGGGEAFAWTCDLSYEYVRINAEYRT
jgi:glutamate N-acetyltransferase/amino-acid N-acetyltransferase